MKRFALLVLVSMLAACSDMTAPNVVSMTPGASRADFRLPAPPSVGCVTNGQPTDTTAHTGIILKRPAFPDTTGVDPRIGVPVPCIPKRPLIQVP